jgi:hypothetical protein
MLHFALTALLSLTGQAVLLEQPGVCLSFAPKTAYLMENCDEYTDPTTEFLQRAKKACKSLADAEGHTTVKRSWSSRAKCDRAHAKGICHIPQLSTNMIYYSNNTQNMPQVFQELCEKTQKGTWETLN